MTTFGFISGREETVEEKNLGTDVARLASTDFFRLSGGSNSSRGRVTGSVEFLISRSTSKFCFIKTWLSTYLAVLRPVNAQASSDSVTMCILDQFNGATSQAFSSHDFSSWLRRHNLIST